jgi:pimeloyl-ACP methyl ester carboxylesterase
MLLLCPLAACAAAGGEELSQAGPLPEARQLTLTGAGGRAVEVRLLHPRCTAATTQKLLLFSHGANSAPAKYDRLAAGWAARGFVVASPLHADSPDHAGGGKVEQANSWRYRVEDMRLLIDQAGELSKATGCRLAKDQVAATGHSYGALVAQALGGARLANQESARDGRVKVVVAFSPPGPIPNYIEPAGWSQIEVPMFVQTGTADALPMIAPTWDKHLVSYEASRAPAVLFVGEGVDHYFGNIIGRPERPEPTQDVTSAFAAAVDLSTDFLRVELNDDKQARARLDADAVRARYPRAILTRYERRGR